MPNLDRFNDNAFRFFDRPVKVERCKDCWRPMQDGYCSTCNDEEEDEEEAGIEDVLAVLCGFPALSIAWAFSILVMEVVSR